MMADPASSTVAVLVNGTTAATALAGWSISSNGTAQTLSAWSGGKCTQDSIAAPAGFVPGFAFCPGAADNSLFPLFSDTYPYGAGGGVALNLYGQPPNGALAGFLDAAQGCALVNVISFGNPVSGGAFSINVLNGAGVRPAPEQLALPDYC